MTATIPDALRDWPLRDAHGRITPWINVWSGEMPETAWVMRFDSVVGAVAIQAPPNLQGVGEPDFTRQEMRRQRRCMVRRLCQVCTSPVGTTGLLVVGTLSCEVQNVQGMGRLPLLTEPWLCEPCARYALTVCPGLIRRGRQEDLLLIRPDRTKVVLSRGYLDGPLSAQSRRVQPVMWAKLAVHIAHVVEEIPKP